MQLKLHQLTLCVLLTLNLANSSVAQTSEEEDLALVYGDTSYISIATGNQQTLRRAPSVASVITAEEIAAMGAANLDEVLEMIPGLHVARSSARYAPLYIIRGVGANSLTSPQVLFMQNGIPMTTLYQGERGPSWVASPIKNISRVEVIRGPGSALYGADAFSGVINIITKSSNQIAGVVSGVRVGSFNSREAWLQYGGQWGEADIATYLQLGRTDGSKELIQADAQSRNDMRFNTQASLAPGPLNTGNTRVDAAIDLSSGLWEMRAGYKQRDLQTGAGIASALDPVSIARSEIVNSDVSWLNPELDTNLGAGVTLSLLHSSFTYPNNIMLYPAGAKVGPTTFPNGMIGGPNEWERQFRLSGFITLTGLPAQSIRIGAGHDHLDMYRTKTVKNYTLSPTGAPISPGAVIDNTAIQPHILPHLRKLSYVFVQDEWAILPDWTMTAGLRHDQFSDFGGTTNPRISLVWDARSNLTAKLLYGSAFRAPSFAEQYTNNPVSQGGINLRPERSDTTELAILWGLGQNVNVNANVFDFRQTDLIGLSPNAPPTPGSTYSNIGSAQGRGGEIEIKWARSYNLTMSANYAYQRIKDTMTGLEVGYAPNQQMSLQANWRPIDAWLTSMKINHVRDRQRAPLDTRPPISNYTIIDVTAKTENRSGWNAAITINNLFNRYALEPTMYAAPVAGFSSSLIPGDLPLPSRSLWLELTYKMD